MDYGSRVLGSGIPGSGIGDEDLGLRDSGCGVHGSGVRVLVLIHYWSYLVCSTYLLVR
jgi:hypothetical protein